MIKHPQRSLLFASLVALPSVATHAALTDLSSVPLATTNPVLAKPNLLFVLDNSGSMSWDYMPDDLGDSYDDPQTTWLGYWSSQCNGVAYDPTTEYLPPIDAAGQAFANITDLTKVPTDGFNASSNKVNVTSRYFYYYEGQNSDGSSKSGRQKAMAWKYKTSDGLPDTATDFYKQCSADVSSITYSNLFKKILVSDLTTAYNNYQGWKLDRPWVANQQQNYANWYAFYRKRYLLMRTGLGLALKNINDKYRVGFSTISDKDALQGEDYFLDVKDFNSTQKSSFYTNLYAVPATSSTPLRGALSKAGKYFANKASKQAYDPVQYSCQRNYTLLSTDGYWNTGAESTSSPKYGPYKLDNTTAVGNQDWDEARPMKDASTVKITKTETSTATGYRTKLWTENKTRTWSQQSKKSALQTCKSGKKSYDYTVYTYERKYVETVANNIQEPQQNNYTKTITTEYTDGIITSGPSAPVITVDPTKWVLKTGEKQSSVSSTNGPPVSSSWTPAGGNLISTSCSSTPVEQDWTTTNANPSWTTTTTTPSYLPSATPTLAASDYSSPVVTESAPVISNGSSDSLADVAQYYWETDLRTTELGNCTSSTSGKDVCANNVKSIDGDPSTSQHMNTFTIGLGLSGTLQYEPNYKQQSASNPGDYYKLTNGTANWPTPSTGGNDARKIDDLWHAAVNGRGTYYSAMNADELTSSITSMFDNIEKKDGAAAAAATSTLELVKAGNLVFSGRYTTQFWYGDLLAYDIDGNAKIAEKHSWSARETLDAMSWTSRKIYFNNGSELSLFGYDNLTATQRAYFTGFCNKDVKPTITGIQAADQCATLTAAQITDANDGSKLVDYLAGDVSNEGKLFRDRYSVLGDIINAAPVYVGKPPFGYSDDGYADFVANNKARDPVVYVAANDGMLHAFSAKDGDSGKELWAFIPTAVMPNLYKLADDGYKDRHQYFVDNTPVMADVKIGSDWKTIVVGGLNAGGKSYYALDITSPSEPKLLWEFTDPNLGYTFGNPIITKRQDGTWVVVFTSGYNNTDGDGKGHFFMVDVATGKSVLKDGAGNAINSMTTGVGDKTSPSGLGKMNAWIDDTLDNTAKHFYAGDMFGNVWRFDPDGRYKKDSSNKPVPNVTKLAVLQIDATKPQPITTKPVTALISNKPVVIIGTGRYLGESDVEDSTQQSIYAIRDPLDTSSWGDVRKDTSNFVKQTMVLNAAAADATSASVTTQDVDWEKGGWWLDFALPRERVAINMGLQLNTLAIGTAVPNGDACTIGGSSWRYYLNIATGGAAGKEPAGVLWNKTNLLVGISWVKDADGNVRTIFQDSRGVLTPEVPPTNASSSGGSAHRTSWRELVD